MIDPADVTALLDAPGPVLSVYVRFEPAERDLRLPEADLRRLIGEARAQCEERGLDGSAQQALLAPLEALSGANLAEHRDPALALFAGAGASQTVPLQEDVPELVVLGSCAHIKPLLPMLARTRRFHILALSSTRARLLTATPYEWQERELEALPLAAQAALDSRSAADPDALAAERNQMIAEDANRLAHAVQAALGPNAGPIVLVAEPQAAGHFSKSAGLPDLLPEAVQVNPFALSDADLHARALAAIAPALEAEVDAVLEQVQARLGTAESTVAIRLEEILAAGLEGRVDAIVVAGDESLWGRYTPGRVVIADGHRAPGDEDLINLAAVQAMRTGARAFARPRDTLPRQVPAVALLRF